MIKVAKSVFFYIFWMIFSVLSCTTNSPDVEGLDYTDWIYDQSGCKGDREKMIHLIDKNKEKFLRFNQNQIIAMFGKPENQTLYTRSQTIYYYHIKNSPNCSDSDKIKDDSNTMMLQIRFDALNRSKEVFVFNYNQ